MNDTSRQWVCDYCMFRRYTIVKKGVIRCDSCLAIDKRNCKLCGLVHYDTSCSNCRCRCHA